MGTLTLYKLVHEGLPLPYDGKEFTLLQSPVGGFFILN